MTCRAALLVVCVACCVACTTMRPVVAAVDAACTLALVDSPVVRQSATSRGVPVAELAALLCAVPAVYEAWQSAAEGRKDPTSAAVSKAAEEGLL